MIQQCFELIGCRYWNAADALVDCRFAFGLPQQAPSSKLLCAVALGFAHIPLDGPITLWLYLGVFCLKGIGPDVYFFAGGYWLIKIAKKKGAAGAFVELRPWASLISHYLFSGEVPMLMPGLIRKN